MVTLNCYKAGRVTIIKVKPFRNKQKYTRNITCDREKDGEATIKECFLYWSCTEMSWLIKKTQGSRFFGARVLAQGKGGRVWLYQIVVNNNNTMLPCYLVN